MPRTILPASSATSSGFLNGSALAKVHVLIGLLLFVLATWLVLRLMRQRPPRGALAWALVTWTGVVGAVFNGASFLNYGHDFSSMLMSTGFALVLLGCGMLLARHD